MKTRSHRSRPVSRRAALVVSASAGPGLVAGAAAGTAPSPAGPNVRSGPEGPRIERLNPSGIAAPRGYTHVVSVTGGRTIHIAGQVSADAAGAVVGKGDLRAQIDQAFANLRTALRAAGASPRDVVKTNVYIVNLKPADLTLYREIRGAFFPVDPPASTLVGVTALASPDYLVEIEATAVIR